MFLGKKYLNLVIKPPIIFYLESRSFGHIGTTELVHKGIFKKSYIHRKPLLAKSYDFKSPSKGQWAEFCEALDRSLAFKWDNEYATNSVVHDGMSWIVKIQFSDGRGIHSSGCNAYPVDTQWDRFNLAVNKLLGIQWLDYKK